MLREQVQAIRASAAAQVAMADAILRALDGQGVAARPSETCLHQPEARMAAGRMGAPDAWVCTSCGVTGGD